MQKQRTQKATLDGVPSRGANEGEKEGEIGSMQKENHGMIGGEEGLNGAQNTRNMGSKIFWANRPSFASLLRPAPAGKEHVSKDLDFILPVIRNGKKGMLLHTNTIKKLEEKFAGTLLV